MCGGRDILSEHLSFVLLTFQWWVQLFCFYYKRCVVLLQAKVTHVMPPDAIALNLKLKQIWTLFYIINEFLKY